MNKEEYYNLGLEKNNLKQYKDAVEIFNEAIELYPDYHIFYFERAMNRTYIEEYDNAIADYKKYIALEENMENADYNHISGSIFGIGYIKFKQEMYDEALNLYRQAKEYNITSELNTVISYATYVCENEKTKCNLLAKIDTFTNEIQDHLDKFNSMTYNYGTEYKTETSDTDNTEEGNGTFIQAFAKYNEQKYDEALKLFGQCIKEFPDNDRAYFYTGCIYEIKRDCQNALINYTKAIELNPDCLMYLNIRAKAYYMDKKYKEAVADWDKIIESAPDYAVDYSLKANAEILMKQ